MYRTSIICFLIFITGIICGQDVENPESLINSILDSTYITYIDYIEADECSIVTIEVCIERNGLFIRALEMPNFTFAENDEIITEDRVEQLSFCPPDTFKIDIVLLLDFSTSMDHEVTTFFGSLPAFVSILTPLDYRIAIVVFNGCPAEYGGVWLIDRTDFSSPTCDYSSTGPDIWADNFTDFSCLFSAVIDDLYDWPPVRRGSGSEDQYGAIVRANENLTFRPDASKYFIMFTDERPIVNRFCTPAWEYTDEDLDSIIEYCNTNNIRVYPITPQNGDFEYSMFESSSRRFYTGYPILADSTGGKWFNLYSENYDSLAAGIAREILAERCCYEFRIIERDFCNDFNIFSVSVSDSDIFLGSDDTSYVPPCPSKGQAIYPYPCGGISTCPDQSFKFLFSAEKNVFYPDSNSLSLVINGETLGIHDSRIDFIDSILIFQPLSDFNNGDTVYVLLPDGTDTFSCPVKGDSCYAIIDLQGPVFPRLEPEAGSVILYDTLNIEIEIFDSLAGVDWSAIDSGNFSITVNSVPWSFDISITPPQINLNLESEGLGKDNEVQICLTNIIDAPDYNYCSPNSSDTCWSFTLIIREGPIGQRILPNQEIISACVNQQIWIAITDSDGVDDPTIVIAINEDTFTIFNYELSFNNDTLYFIPLEDYWADKETVTVSLIRADDNTNCELQNPFEWTFYMDLLAPQAEMLEPEDSNYTININQPIKISISDNFAGIDTSNSKLFINDIEYDLNNSLQSLTNGNKSGLILFNPLENGLVWLPSDTVNVYLYLCDDPDTCDGNCAEYRYSFWLPPYPGCTRLPNPFTPNSDNINDKVQFTFPGMIYSPGLIYIFDVQNKMVKEITIPKGVGAKEFAIWDGSDNNNDPLPQGLYIYLIKSGGEVVCNGTVTIAR